LTAHLKELDRQVKEFEREIVAWHRNSELSRKLDIIPGIGPLAASALVASIADARSFKNGRQVSAWLGGEEQGGQHSGMVDRTAQASAPEYCRGGTGQQKRAHRVGDTRPWLEVLRSFWVLPTTVLPGLPSLRDRLSNRWCVLLSASCCQ
jgi:hypothetical protein